MKNRQDFIKHLRQSDKFKAALSAARTPEERAQVKALTEEFVGGFADVLGPIIERAQNDPEFAQQLGRSLAGQQIVLSTSDSVISGSTD